MAQTFFHASEHGLVIPRLDVDHAIGGKAGLGDGRREEIGPRLDLTIGEEGPLLAALLRDIVERGADIFHFQTRQVSLEEIYLRRLTPAAPAPQAAEVTVC